MIDSHRWTETHHITCREFIDFLVDYLAGELPPASQAEFEFHLSDCPLRVVSEELRGNHLRQSGLLRLNAPLPADVPKNSCKDSRGTGESVARRHRPNFSVRDNLPAEFNRPIASAQSPQPIDEAALLAGCAPATKERMKPWSALQWMPVTVTRRLLRIEEDARDAVRRLSRHFAPSTFEESSLLDAPSHAVNAALMKLRTAVSQKTQSKTCCQSI
jgi:hypothetical protein